MRPSFEEIYDTTLEVLNINRSMFASSGSSRHAHIMKAKQIMCFVARHVGYTSMYIGEQIGLNYATVIYHEQKAKGYIKYEPEYAEQVSKVLSILSIPCRTHTKSGYIVRDKEDNGGYLYFCAGEKPQIDDDSNIWTTKNGVFFDIPKEAFPQITWEKGPVACEMTLKLK